MGFGWAGARCTVRIEPRAAQTTVHHMLLYGCDGDASDGADGHTNMLMRPMCARGNGERILYGWAKDALPMEYPRGVGLAVGSNARLRTLVLQVPAPKPCLLQVDPATGDSSQTSAPSSYSTAQPPTQETEEESRFPWRQHVPNPPCSHRTWSPCHSHHPYTSNASPTVACTARSA